MTEAEIGVNNLKGRKAVGVKPSGSHALIFHQNKEENGNIFLSPAKPFKNVTLNIGVILFFCILTCLVLFGNFIDLLNATTLYSIAWLQSCNMYSYSQFCTIASTHTHENGLHIYPYSQILEVML